MLNQVLSAADGGSEHFQTLRVSKHLTRFKYVDCISVFMISRKWVNWKGRAYEKV